MSGFVRRLANAISEQECRTHLERVACGRVILTALRDPGAEISHVLACALMDGVGSDAAWTQTFDYLLDETQ
jgi:hypothetical protein